jgi:hypothetical protein
MIKVIILLKSHIFTYKFLMNIFKNYVYYYINDCKNKPPTGVSLVVIIPIFINSHLFKDFYRV